jgi:hypothetical protein
LKKASLTCLLILLVLTVYLTGCGAIIFPEPLPEFPDLTLEEITLLTEHSYGGNCVIRWPIGSIIKVYDETNFSQLTYVFDEWNEALEGDVVLLATKNSSEAQVRIVRSDLQGSLAGYASVSWNDYKIYKGLVEIDFEWEIGNEPIDLYLHEFGHILGFHDHLEEGVMAQGSGFTYVDQTVKDYFLNLYSLPTGYCF